MFIPLYTVTAIVRGPECSHPSPDFTYSIIYSKHILFSGTIMCVFLTLVQSCYLPKYTVLLFCNFLPDAVLLAAKWEMKKLKTFNWQLFHYISEDHHRWLIHEFISNPIPIHLLLFLMFYFLTWNCKNQQIASVFNHLLLIIWFLNSQISCQYLLICLGILLW